MMSMQRNISVSLLVLILANCAGTEIRTNCPDAIWPTSTVEFELESLKNVEVDAWYFSIIEQQEKLEICGE
jgi:hypothetical protein